MDSASHKLPHGDVSLPSPCKQGRSSAHSLQGRDPGQGSYPVSTTDAGGSSNDDLFTMASKDMFATDYGMSYTFFNSPLRLTSESASSHTVPAGIFVPPASPTVRRDTVRQGLVVRIREGLWSESERAFVVRIKRGLVSRIIGLL